MDVGAPELLIILVIVILLFGVGRVGKIGGELGTAVANFRKGLQDGTKESAETPVVEAKSEDNKPQNVA